MKIRAWPATALLVLVASSASPTALPNCLDQVARNLAAVGRPEAGEVASELREMQRTFDQLSAEARRLADEQAGLEDEQARLERAQLERQQRLANVRQELTVANSEADGLRRRREIHDAEARQAQAAQDDEWGARINARKDQLDREAAALQARMRQLMARQNDLMNIAAQAAQFRDMHARRERLDQQLDQTIRQCSDMLSRSLALTRIAGAPSRPVEYRAPSEIAESVTRSLARGVGGTALTITLRYGQSGRSMRRELFPLVRGASRLGLTAARANAAVLVAELATESLLAGANQNEREIVRNIYLIGDYAEALKVLFRERGAAAAASPEYQAIRSELERLRAEMPTSEAGFLLDSAAEPAAFVAAFLGVARRYIGRHASRLAGAAVPRLSRNARVDTSMPVVRALRQATMSSLTVPAGVAVGTTIDAARREGEAVANRMENIEPDRQ